MWPLLRFFVFLTLALKLFTGHMRSEYSIPMNKKGLREIRFDSNYLVEKRRQRGLYQQSNTDVPDDECHDNLHCFLISTAEGPRVNYTRNDRPLSSATRRGREALLDGCS